MLNKKLILGIGISGMSCIEFFNKININYKVFDTRDKKYFNDYNIQNINTKSFYCGEYPDDFLDDIDEVIVSPGLNKNHKIFSDIVSNKINIITDIDIFKRYCKSKIISVTGTNGKTTVVTMLEHALNTIGYKAVACGNNGVPPLTIIDSTYDYVILELSSYQLEYMSDLKSFISIITNIDYDHLDRHENIENYSYVKLSIFNDSIFRLATNSIKQLTDDVKQIKFYGLCDNGSLMINDNVIEGLYYDETTIYYKEKKLEYRGKHNLNNILSVISALDIINIEIQSVLFSLENYNYLPHRLELIDSTNNINWYNDSKSTNCASTKAALECINKKIILILGGSKKEMYYESLSSLINKKVKLIIFIGENKEYIKSQLKINIQMINADSIESAVELSKLYSSDNDNILLSPASPSFDMFENYEERGAAFILAVQNIVK